MPIQINNLLLSIVLIFVISHSTAEEETPATPLEELLIIGVHPDTDKITGSAHYIGAEILEKFEHSDIQRIINQIPGVAIQTEDGYGLRPNISIRGVTTERSSRITLLEDNVLIAPAPYSAPSAYYFPTPGRMQAFEIVKGPAAITQGPYTIGGALNMLSTTIPQESKGKALIEYGADSTLRLHLNYGNKIAISKGYIGYLIETHQWQSDGYQSIDRAANDTGLNVTDYMLKLSYTSNDKTHYLEFKYQLADQKSDQSYLGLSDSDFMSNPYRRYGLSALDNIETDHEQVILKHRFAITDSLTLTSTAYNNEHQRDWYKTEGIDFNGSAKADEFSSTNWYRVINAVNTDTALVDDDGTSISVATLQEILDGTLDTPEGSIQIRSNKRTYYSRGIQSALQWTTTTGGLSHDIKIGFRYHEDQEDRLQLNSTFQQVDGELELNDLGINGNAGNRIQDAKAYSLFVYDRLQIGDLILSPGLRYENISQSRTRYTDGADRIFRDGRSNSTTVLLPGFGLRYLVNDAFSVIAGVHKGFSAPSNSSDVKAEEAINYELGWQYKSGILEAEALWFYSDYKNLLGVCTVASGNSCEVGDAFNGEAATIWGLEAMLKKSLLIQNKLSVDFSLTYTYSKGTFDTDIADTAFFGDVSKGDSLPYIPEHQLGLSIYLEYDIWNLTANLNYVDAVCTRAACQTFERTEDALTLDLASQLYVLDNLKIFTRIENINNNQSILGRHPYGARPAKARSFNIGAKFEF